MIHIYKDELDEIDYFWTPSFENLFTVVHLSLLLNQFLLHITLQHPLKSAKKH